jgi:small subunit ribosomal protein S5
MVMGNRRGKVGLGLGKARDVAQAIDKATNHARKNLVELKLTKSNSIPHEVQTKFGGSVVMVRPSPGRGVVAGGAARAIFTLGGVHDVSAKFVSRSKNHLNNARATLEALKTFSAQS